MTFVKGVSGNPKGRPKKSEEMRTVLRALLRAKDPGTGLPNKDLAVRGLLKAAAEGNVGAIALIFERIDGRTKDEQNVEHTGEVTIRVVRDRVGPAPAHPAPLPAEDPG